MALNKQLDLGGGKLCKYFKIIGLHSNTLYSSTVVRLAAYPDKDARDKDEASYLKVLPLALKGIDLNRETCYKMIKELPDFEGSEDI